MRVVSFVVHFTTGSCVWLGTTILEWLMGRPLRGFTEKPGVAWLVGSLMSVSVLAAACSGPDSGEEALTTPTTAAIETAVSGDPTTTSESAVTSTGTTA